MEDEPMGIYSHHTSCPKCNSRDNRAVYKDGSSYCFGCHYSTPPTIEGRFKNVRKQINPEEEQDGRIYLPPGLTQDFSEEAVKYASTYGITVPELISHGYFYRQSTGQLVRIFYEGLSGVLCSIRKLSLNRAVACESRRLRPQHILESQNPSITTTRQLPKSRFYGSKEAVEATAGTERPCKTLVLTEDSFSSIVVGRVVHAMPLFGTSISVSKLTRLSSRYTKIIVWLDRDKFKEAWEIALKLKWLNIITDVILTDLDPKCYDEQSIRKYLKLGTEDIPSKAPA